MLITQSKWDTSFYFRKIFNKLKLLNNIKFLNKLFSSNNQRSLGIKKNISGIFVIKGLNIVITFILFPITIHYISPSEYGIWLTLGSIIGWFNYFELGLSNGLRNNLTEALARDDHELARKLISTTYAILFLGMVALSIFVLPSIYFVNWRVLLNTPFSNEEELRNLAYIVFLSFCLRFVLQVITTILLSVQKPALNNLTGLLSNFLTLIFVLILKYTTKPSILILGIALSIVPVLVLVSYTVIFYSTIFKNLKPSFANIELKYIRKLFSLGIQFFIIQISGLVLFSLTNLLLSHFFNPTAVTTYAVAYKYFSTVYMIFNILLTPYWSAFTEAYIKNDIDWIKKSMKKLNILWGIFFVISVIMLLCSDFFFNIWMGKTIKIPFSLSIALTLFFLLNSYSAIYISFINGVSKIRLSIIQAVFEMIIFLPLVYLFIKILGLDIAGIVIATSISPIIALLWMPKQYNKIITNSAKGIWNK